MNPFLRYLADKRVRTDTQTDTRRWPQDLAAYGAQVIIREPPKFGSTGDPPSLGWSWPPENKSSHIKFGRSASKDVCRNRREPQNWTALGHCPLAVGCAWHHRNVPLHTCSAAGSYLPEKCDPSRPTFQGHSRSSEPTRIDPPPMTFY